MKLKALLLLTVFALGVVAAPALADKGKGKGKGKDDAVAVAGTGTETTGTTTEAGKREKAKDKARPCPKGKKLVVHGTFVSGSATSLTVNVVQANRAGKALKGADATFAIDAKTKVHGAKKTLAALAVGDRVVVQARACQTDATAPATLVALKVGVKGAKHEDDDKDEKTSTTTSTTTTTTTTP